jgi:hypothetical protein
MNKNQALVKLTQEELQTLRDLSSNMNQAKMAFGSIEIERHRLYRNLDMLQMEIAKNENDLIAKYGKNAHINMQTGEVTQKNTDGIN